MKSYSTIQMFLVLILFVTTQCSPPVKEAEKIPIDILPKEKMIQYYIDFHLMEAAITELNLPTDSAKKLFIFYEKALLKKHKLSDSLYNRSHKYYTTHPKIYDKIYETVIDSLNYKESRKMLN